MIIFTWKGRTDKFLKTSIRREEIIIPDGAPIVEDGTLFIFDDLTPLGIKCPSELIDTLKQNNIPTTVLNAQDLATNIVNKVPVREKIALMSGGGILSYLFLRRAGYQGKAQGIIDIRRTYQEGKPTCELISKPNFIPSLIMEDIIASGQTLEKALVPYRNNEPELACLMASSNISQGNKGYRKRAGSTISEVPRMYCSQLVNGAPDGTKKPSILSLRYLVTKAVDDKDYNNTYLAKKFGGIEQAVKIGELVKDIDRQQIDLLRKDPISFLRNSGVEVRS